jgi:hypothetical protein
MFGLAHIDILPLLYGITIFVGLASMWRKLINFQVLPLIIEVSVFWLVFSLHGGTMTGGFAATIAALLAGFFLPRMIRV